MRKITSPLVSSQQITIVGLCGIVVMNLLFGFRYANEPCLLESKELDSNSPASNSYESEILEYSLASPPRHFMDCEATGIHTQQLGFQLIWSPSASQKPFRVKKAAVTMYAAPANNNGNAKSGYDTAFADALILAHSLGDSETAEFVVAVTGFVSHEKQLALQRAGARLLRLPDLAGAMRDRNASAILDTFHKPCLGCFSKLYLWGLEAIFTDVLYLDGGLVLAPTFSLDRIFAYAANQPSTYLGAVPVYRETSEREFDSSVILFKPSVHRMHRLLRLAQQGNFFLDPFADQALLNFYYSGPKSPSCTMWSALPDSYNMQNPEIRNIRRVMRAHVVQASFWTMFVTRGSPLIPIYKRWSETISKLQTFQLKEYRKSDVGSVPPSTTDLHAIVKANTFSSSFAILSVLIGHEVEFEMQNRTVSNRQRYCNAHPAIYHHIQTELTAKNALWEKVYASQKLMETFDWIWLLDARDALIMNGDVDLRILLGRLLLEEPNKDVDIVISRDFNEMNAGSFFVRSSEWSKQVFIDSWLQDEFDEDGWQEQKALIRMRDENRGQFRDHLMELPQQRSVLFNSYIFGVEGWGRTFVAGDFVLHNPGNGWESLYRHLAENKLREF